MWLRCSPVIVALNAKIKNKTSVIDCMLEKKSSCANVNFHINMLIMHVALQSVK